VACVASVCLKHLRTCIGRIGRDDSPDALSGRGNGSLDRRLLPGAADAPEHDARQGNEDEQLFRRPAR
jgi:hypothetical protein